MIQFISNQKSSHLLIVVVFVFFYNSVFSQNNTDGHLLNIPEYTGSAQNLIEHIGKSENIVFAYSSAVNLSHQVHFKQGQMQLNNFIDKLLKGQPLGYKISGNKVLFFLKEPVEQPTRQTQTIRGTITDIDSKEPLIGATITVMDTDPLIGTATNEYGYFKLSDVPLGRTTVQLSCMGYAPILVQNIEVNSGKEVVLELNMKESSTNLTEVQVKADRNKGEATNEMSIISVRSISTEETKRYAAGYDDPSHILTNFAGISNTPSGNNDIIVRGNAPKYMQWRLEGVEITAPNHQSDQNSTVGGFSALNNSLLSASDFYSGAFSSEFGDVLSGVYDIKLRQGNNEKFEATAGVGIMGTNFTIEGPFAKGYTGSYLINYRFSNIGLIQSLKLADIPGISTTFQDANFKVVLPSKKHGTLSLFGLLGYDNLTVQKIVPNVWKTPGNNQMIPSIVQSFEQKNHLVNIGINHNQIINSTCFLKTTVSISSTGINENIFERNIIKTIDENGVENNDTLDKQLNNSNNIKTTVYRAKVKFSKRLNAQNKIVIGTEYAINSFSTTQSMLDDSYSRFMLADFEGHLGIFKNYFNWKYQLNETMLLVAGIHNQNNFMNKKSTIEPRIAVNWQLTTTSALQLGYGKHSSTEHIHNYLTRIKQPDQSVVEPNRNLDFLKADHYIAGYNQRLTENLNAKIEVYYQRLYNLPVENSNTSFYCTINESSDYRYVPLVNKGTGKNYGVEFTLERFFSNHYYFLINTSIFDSKYTALDGIERNTRFNSNILANVLCGKEFEKLGKLKNKTFSINVKFFFSGGQRYIPLLRDANGNVSVDLANKQFWDYNKAYVNKLDNLYHFDISFSYKINKKKSTHEIFLDLPNVTNHQGRMAEYYDISKPNNIGYITQMVFLPNIMYRVYF